MLHASREGFNRDFGAQVISLKFKKGGYSVANRLGKSAAVCLTSKAAPRRVVREASLLLRDRQYNISSIFI